MFSYLTVLVGILATCPALLVKAGQIPIVNGVVGGVSPEFNSRTPFENFAQTTFSDVITHAQPAIDVMRTPGKLRIKSENSGICESTEGVYQATGYGDISELESVWYVAT